MLGTLTPNFNSSFTFQSPHLRRFVGAAFTEAAKTADSSSLYEVLRIKRDASQVEIKTAYRTLAKLYHPDATSRFMDSSTNGRDFMELHDAYATLSDPDARAVYDFNLNVNLRRRWNASESRCPGRTRFSLTRTWETDQCW